MSVVENLAEVNARIADACRASGRARSEVRLVAVSKRQPIERVEAAYRAGQRDFGENYVQELERKRSLIGSEARWDLIGHLQTNKAKRAVGAHLIHTVDSERIAHALAKAVPPGQRQAVLIEVNIGLEDSKAGVLPDAAEGLLAAIAPLEAIDVCGVMCIPPEGEGRRWFAALRALRDRLATRSGLGLGELSMGMSDDYEDAILEGATIVRVGTAIFGERDTPFE